MAQEVVIPETEQVPTTIDLKVPEWILDNLERQFRERYLERHTIPDLDKRQKTALKPMTDQREKINEGLKKNAENRIKAYKAKANKKQLTDILKEEVDLMSQKVIKQQEIDDEREKLGYSAKIKLAKDTNEAHKWKRYQQLDDNLGALNVGDKPLETEETDVAEYLSAKENTKDLIRQAIIL